MTHFVGRTPFSRMGTSVIVNPYLLVLNSPLHWQDGSNWADPLWEKDLEAHCVQIDTLAIACPVVRRPPPRDG